MMKLKDRIKRKWVKLRLQPIRVFCLHHVCEVFDGNSMNAVDWMSIDVFKQKVVDLQKDGFHFISLTEAYEYICNDYWRIRKYAVFTFDDGYESLKEIIPWMEGQGIPYCLFINGKYLDGSSYRKFPGERYLNLDELFELNNQLVEIGSHGWEHISSSKMPQTEFENSVIKNMEVLKSHPRFVRFYAYTYGHHSQITDSFLRAHSLVPLLINGGKNYNNCKLIDRELL